MRKEIHSVNTTSVSQENKNPNQNYLMANRNTHSSQHVKINTKLDEEQEAQVRALLERYKNCFEDPLSKLGQLKGVEATIPLLPGANPTYHKGYRRSPIEHNIMSKDIEKLLKMGVIEPGNGEWSSPPLYAPKKTGELRFCINYRDLNKKTRTDSYPLPRIDDMLDILSEARYFSLLNATSGYWQILIKQKDKHKTGFTTREGLFQFNSLPFGLKNTPVLFQRIMNNIYQGLL
jgi:hypothetical protein